MKNLKKSIHSLYSPAWGPRIKKVHHASKLLSKIDLKSNFELINEISSEITEFKIFEFPKHATNVEAFSDGIQFGGKTEVKLDILSDRCMLVISENQLLFA